MIDKEIIAINKPKGPTSHDIVHKIRKITGEKRVGHAGTLDPLAEGVLVIGITRKGTRQLEKYVQGEKVYEAGIKLGENSTTDDDEGEKTKVSKKIPTQDEIEKTLKKFEGKVSQIPPLYSAIKIKGKASYKYARKGEEIKLEARQVEIKKITLINYQYPILKIEVTTGKGVYIRSLARDIGKMLGTGGHLSSLKRTKVGPFTTKDTLTLEEFEKNEEI